MSYEYSEDQLIEQATEDVLKELGWQVVTAWTHETFGEKGLLGRETKAQVILEREVLKALKKYNPDLPEISYTRAVEKLVLQEADLNLAQINKKKYDLLKNGVEVSYTDDKGVNQRKKLQVFNFKDYTDNDFLAVRQLEVSGPLHNRRPDVIGFVNGIPLVFIELKSHAVDLRAAYDDNFTDYKDTIAHLFHHNAFVILSNGTDAKVGTVTSPYKYFLDWKRITEESEGIVSLDTMLRGVCDRSHLMDIFENFLLFDQSSGSIVKLMAKNHQFIGVNRVLDNVDHIKELKGKLGVFWHTQGSGKTYSMVFLCEKIHRKLGGAYTFLIVVDRSELENQAYDTFSGVGVVADKDVIAGKKKGMTGREHLRELLSENHRYVFTLIHKFSIDPKVEESYPLITDRENIIVLSDEAHRTQGGKYARNMRYNALPNASFLGFTGTPIIKDEEEITKNIFGEYVSVYDFKRAIEDEATLPLKYLNRGKKLHLENPEMDEAMAEALEDESLDTDQKAKLSYLFQKSYPVLTATKRLKDIAKDLVWHFNERGYQGKAMLVALDKPTAVRMYDYIKEYWPEYLKELKTKINKSSDAQEQQELERHYRKVEETEVCVIVSQEQNEIDKFKKLNLDIMPHRKKMMDRNLEKEFKDEENPFRLAIVCAMWITGFDAPCISTVYLDKPIKSHTLMQTIARANRVYDDEKENGLIVDYGNVYLQLQQAYSVYGEGGNKEKDESKGSEKPLDVLESLEGELKKAIDAVILFLRSKDFELNSLIDAKPMERIAKIKDAIDAVCFNDESRATFETAARNVFRKYKALYPEIQAKKYTPQFNAIDAIYSKLHEKKKEADVTEIIVRLQNIVDHNVDIEYSVQEKGEVYVDLSKLNFEALKKAFTKIKRKNEAVFDLKEAAEQQLERMMAANPMRINFYERYQEIIEAYNKGKDQVTIQKAFEDLMDFIASMNEETRRHVHENVDEPTLSIFDLLIQNKELTKKEREKVKEVAEKTLVDLKQAVLNIQNWKESRELRAKAKSTIYDHLLWLPQDVYTDEEVSAKTVMLFQHVYSYQWI